MCRPPQAETATAQPSSATSSNEEKVWKSPYNPLAKDAPELPSKAELKATIPKECFERSYFWSFFYLFRDFAMAGAFAYATSLVLSTTPPSLFNEPVQFMLWTFGWSFHAFWQGTIMTGPWVLGHECGHMAFSPSKTCNDITGFIVHQLLLVPYFAWQFTHAKHHARTNHLVDGESHVPSDMEDTGLGENYERESFYAVWHEVMGDDAFAVFQIWSHLFLGWPLYLMGLASTGRLAWDGSPLDGRIADHFRTDSPMFPPSKRITTKVFLSSFTVFASLVGLFYLKYVYGPWPVILYYWGPYTFTNAWLVLYTWLQHTDPSIPHYDHSEWTWVKGALSTIDRPYGIFDFFHHTIGSTHLCHHLFHELPWYNADVATAHLKAYLEPKGLYNYDPTPWWAAMWRIARTCHFMDSREGIQYFKSLEDVPLTKDLNKKQD